MSETEQPTSDAIMTGEDDSKQVSYGEECVCKCGKQRNADESFCTACGDGNKPLWRKKLLLQALEAADKPKAPIRLAGPESSVLAEIDYDEAQLEEWKEKSRVRAEADTRLEAAKTNFAGVTARGASTKGPEPETGMREKIQAELELATAARKEAFEKAKTTPEELEMLRQRVAKANLAVKEKTKAKTDAQALVKAKNDAILQIKRQQYIKAKHEAAARAFAAAANAPPKDADPTKKQGWQCVMCKTNNPAWKLGCFSCLASKINPDGTWVCATCETSYPSTDSECSKCQMPKHTSVPSSGSLTPTPITAAETRLYALIPKCQCGRAWESVEKFCAGCGRARQSAVKPAGAPLTPVTTPVPNAGPALKGKGWICNCGAFYLREDTCKKCGSTRAAVLEGAAKRRLVQDPVSEAERLLRESSAAERAAEEAAAQAREKLAAAERKRAAAAEAKRAVAGPQAIERINPPAVLAPSLLPNTPSNVPSLRPPAIIAQLNSRPLALSSQLNARPLLDIRTLRDVRSRPVQPGLLDPPRFSGIIQDVRANLVQDVRGSVVQDVRNSIVQDVRAGGVQDMRGTRPKTPPRIDRPPSPPRPQYSSKSYAPDYSLRNSPKKRPLSPHRNPSPPRGRGASSMQNAYNQLRAHSPLQVRPLSPQHDQRSQQTRPGQPDSYSQLTGRPWDSQQPQSQPAQSQFSQYQPSQDRFRAPVQSRPRTPPRQTSNAQNNGQWHESTSLPAQPVKAADPEPSYWEDEASSDTSGLALLPVATESKSWAEPVQPARTYQSGQDSRSVHSNQAIAYPSRNNWY